MNSLLCLAPWTHAYLGPNGERKICTMSNKGLHAGNPISLQSFWNGPYLKEVRCKMMNGEELPECQVCNNPEHSYDGGRKTFNGNYNSIKSELLENTFPDGTFVGSPCSFDYRYYNTCNFKCRMCGVELSSSWEIEQQTGDQKPPVSDFQEEVAQKEFIAALLKGEVEEIYWSGGEPLIWDIHWKVMRLAVENNLSSKINLHYNTNLTVIERDGVHLFRDLLPHFKSYVVRASIDGMGDIGEYIRTGLDWNKWKRNFIEAKSFAGDNLVMDLTLTLPGLFGVIDLLKVADELKTQVLPKLTHSFKPDVMLSPLALPKEILHPFLNMLIKQVFSLGTPNEYAIIKFLTELKGHKTFEELFPLEWEESFVEGRKSLIKLEQKRKAKLTLEQIYSGQPLISKWWTAN